MNSGSVGRCLRAGRTRGHIESLPSGSFRAVVYAGADPLTRKPRYRRETHKSYDGAQVALTRLQSQVDEDRHPRADITLSGRRSGSGWRSPTWPTLRAGGTKI